MSEVGRFALCGTRGDHWRPFELRQDSCLSTLRLISELLSKRQKRAFGSWGVFYYQRVRDTCLLVAMRNGRGVWRICMPRTCAQSGYKGTVRFLKPKKCPPLTPPIPILNFGSQATYDTPSKRPRPPTSSPGSSKKTTTSPKSRGSCPPLTPSKHSGSVSSGEDSSSTRGNGLQFMCLNSRGFNPSKWEKIQFPPFFPHLDVIVLTEYHLPASFRPREMVTSGWNVDMVAGPQMTGSSSH